MFARIMATELDEESLPSGQLRRTLGGFLFALEVTTENVLDTAALSGGSVGNTGGTRIISPVVQLTNEEITAWRDGINFKG